MKHRRLLAGLFGVAAVATGVTAWAIQTHSEASTESKAPPSEHQNANTLLQMGILQEKYHDPKAAAQTYLRVLELEPQNKYAWYDLGVLSQEVGHTADARAAYDRALKTDPVFPPALYNEALLLESREPDRAAALLQRAIAVNPQAGTAHLHLARIWAQRHLGHKAADEYRRTVAVDPSLRSQVPEKYRDSADNSASSSETGSDS
ncbi:tetratricopeptide repeat protein [Streptomyces sp. NPDC004561]